MIFRWWMAPVIGVGICAIANGALIATAFRVRPQKSEAHPYAASAEEDTRASERTSFATHGWSLGNAVTDGGVVLTLHAPPGGTVATVGMVHLFRPDDVSADRDEPWADPSKPLTCALPRPGAWTIRVALRDGSGATLVDDLRINRP
jgi:nitrogen fixation protein FixH